MATVTHQYTINQDVFYVTETNGVREAIVKDITILIPQSGITTIKYTIVYKKTGTTDTVYESGLYGDIDSALNVYKNFIIA